METKIYSIYLGTCHANGKKYVGFTNNINRRFNNYKKIGCQGQHLLYNSLKKYGFDSFTFEVIYQSKDKEYTLNVMEPYFIKLYDTYHNGLNLTSGGPGSKGHNRSKAKKPKSKTPKLLVSHPDGHLEVVYNISIFSKKYGLRHLDRGRFCKGFKSVKILKEDQTFSSEDIINSDKYKQHMTQALIRKSRWDNHTKGFKAVRIMENTYVI